MSAKYRSLKSVKSHLLDEDHQKHLGILQLGGHWLQTKKKKDFPPYSPSEIFSPDIKPNIL